MATYSPSLVANAFLYKARESGAHLSHMKLQKLVYFVHAWSLTLLGQSLVDDRPEAWTYGPVFGSLYHELKSYGSHNIDGYLTQMNPVTGQRQNLVPTFEDSQFWNLFNQVWQRYSSLTAVQLSALTHETNGPWESARQNGNGWLDDEQIRAYYRTQLPAHA